MSGTAGRTRVLHVCEPTHAGAARVTFNLADRLRPLGFDPVVCTPPGELADWCAEASIEVLALPFARRRPGSYRLAFATVGRALASGFGLVHAHSSFSGMLVRARRPAGLPVVFQPHAWSFQALKGPARAASVLAERAGARRTDLLVCVSDDELALGRREGIRARREVVIRNGVDFDDVASRPSERPAAPLVGCVARLAPQKGIDTLLHAVAHPQWPVDTRVEVVGDGPSEVELVALAGRLGLGDRVRFLGRSSNVGEHLARWDLFVLPARYEAGVPIALLEALAAGLPSLCTDIAGVHAIMDGIAVPLAIDDPIGMARAVAAAVADWPTTRRSAEAMRQAAALAYSLPAQAERFAAAYRELLGERDGRPTV
jgi:glycosyltransferase involved in cell wall biosynthesis